MTERNSFVPTDRTTVRRLPKRAHYDRETVYQILDEGFICHIGFVIDGQPYVIPTGYARCGDKLYFHGSAASRMLQSAQAGVDLCLTVTLLDGLVLARSAFHHSMNYRSVVVLGRAVTITDPAEKLSALQVLTEHMIPGRWKEVRPPNVKELSGTMVLSVDLKEVSAKIRKGPPIDDEEDYGLPVWAGEVPLHLASSEPIRDPGLMPGVELPSCVLHYTRPRR